MLYVIEVSVELSLNERNSSEYFGLFGASTAMRFPSYYSNLPLYSCKRKWPFRFEQTNYFCYVMTNSVK